MNKINFTFIAIALGLPLLALLLLSAPSTADGEPQLPLLTMLIVSEFGFIVTAIGAYTAMKTLMAKGKKPLFIAGLICCVLLSIKFLMTGFSYWPL